MIKLTRNREATLRSVAGDRDTWAERYEPGALRWLFARGLIVVESRLAAATDAGRDLVAELVKRDEDRARALVGPEAAAEMDQINPNWSTDDALRERRIRGILKYYVAQGARDASAIRERDATKRAELLEAAE